MKRLRIVSAVLSTLLVLAGLPLVANNSALAATGDVEINETNFPDENFRRFVQNYDNDNDGTLSEQEFNEASILVFGAWNIGSFEGIEHFTTLFYFDYFDSCAAQTAQIDVSHNTALRHFVLDLEGTYQYEGEYYFGADLNLGSDTYLARVYREATPTVFHSDDIYESSRNGNLVYEMTVDGIDCYLELSPNITVTSFAPDSNINMYRLYNPNSGEHFYTSNVAERNTLIGLGWNDEGIGWIAPSYSNTPVYRLYNENAGEHHYTMSIGERDALVEAGWKYEGIGWYSDDSQRVPLYRQYNPNAYANNHNYTTSLRENDDLVALGWRAEAIGWYGLGS